MNYSSVSLQNIVSLTFEILFPIGHRERSVYLIFFNLVEYLLIQMNNLFVSKL